MKNLILLTSILCSFNTFATPLKRVFFLGSLDTPKKSIPFWENKRFTYEEDIGKRLTTYFRNKGLETVIIQDPDQFDLWNIVHRPDTFGIIWMSHAGQAVQLSSGIEAPAVLVTKEGVDIAPIFASINPNINFISFIGCNSEGIVNKYSTLGNLGKVSTRFISFDQKLTPQKGYRKTIDYLDKHLDQIIKEDKEIIEEEKSRPFSFTITRTIPEDAKFDGIPTRIMIGERTFGVFPKMKVGTQKTITFNVSEDELISPQGIKKLDIKLESGLIKIKTEVDYTLGKLDIKTNHPKIKSYRLFSQKDGRPYGVSTNLYLGVKN